MILTQDALKKINTVSIRISLASELKCGEQTIINHIKNNKEDGLLTKAKALQVIKRETGLTENEILTESVPA